QRAVRDRYPDATVHTTADDLWRHADRYEIAVVATPNDTHVPLARAALEAGLAVVVDKPLALTAAQARELTELADTMHLPLTVYQNRRSEEHTSELQSRFDLVCRLLLEKKNRTTPRTTVTAE